MKANKNDPVKKSFTIHDLPVPERPRERLQQFGVEALSGQEILAVIMGRGISGESVMVTAQRLLSEFEPQGNCRRLRGAIGEDKGHRRCQSLPD